MIDSLAALVYATGHSPAEIARGFHARRPRNRSAARLVFRGTRTTIRNPNETDHRVRCVSFYGARVNGSIVKVGPHRLAFPFTMEKFKATAEAVVKEATYTWERTVAQPVHLERTQTGAEAFATVLLSQYGEEHRAEFRGPVYGLTDTERLAVLDRLRAQHARGLPPGRTVRVGRFIFRASDLSPRSHGA